MGFEIRYKDFADTYSEFYNSARHYLEAIEKSKQQMEVNEISERLQIPYSTVEGWIRREIVPVPFREYRKTKKRFSEKDISNLASILGYLFGDGGITAKARVHYCNSENFLINSFISAMNKVFETKPIVRKEEDIIRVAYPNRIGRVL